MDVTSFFNYPTLMPPERPEDLVLLPDASQEDWDRLLAHTETRRFHAGEVLIAEGESDRALYLLTDGRLALMGPGRPEGSPARTVEAPATLGEVAFLDGRPRSGALRALTDGEVLRLSFESFEALAGWDPRLGRDVLLDLGRIVCARLRAAAQGFGDSAD
jgi:CRP/FNR family cyclic AMP-dependent transcriptional regulator